MPKPVPKRDYEGLSSSFEQNATNLSANDLKMLKNHFLNGSDNSLIAGHKYYAAILAVMTTSHLDDAISVVSSKMCVRNVQTERLIVEAVNNAPAPWLGKNQTVLENKGFVRGLEYFHGQRRVHDKGGLLEEITRQIPDDRQIILLAAIDAMYAYNNKYETRVGDSTMYGVATLLMEDGPAKMQMIDRLNEGPGKNRKMWLSANAALEKIVNVLEVDAGLVPPAYDPIAEAKPSKVLQAKMAREARSCDQQAEPIDPQAELKRRLRELEITNAITKREADVYLYAITPRIDGKLPSEMHIQSKFSVRTGPRGSNEQSLPLQELRTIMHKMVPLMEQVEAQETKFAAMLTPAAP
jgi:hypothetical protein